MFLAFISCLCRHGNMKISITDFILKKTFYAYTYRNSVALSYCTYKFILCKILTFILFYNE